MFREILVKLALLFLLGLMLLGASGCCIADLFEEDDETADTAD
jgi:hypothetical protein